MKRILLLLLSLILVFSLMIPVSAASAHFTDVPSSSWYYNNVKTAYENGLMVGVNDTEFRPEDTLTRAMFVTVLGRVAKADLTEYEGTCSFSDVAKTAWYEPYVAWAQAKNVAAGVGNNRFAPDDPVTREQMAALIARYVKTSNITISNAASPAAVFKDTDQISSWAKESVEYTRLTGLLIGDDKGNFSPKKTATRAEAASLFIRLYKAIYTSFPQPVNTWVETPAETTSAVAPETPATSATEYVVPNSITPIVTSDNIIASAKANGIAADSVAFEALVKINTQYGSRLNPEERGGTLLFVFEGCGENLDSAVRYGAMAVVVCGGKIVHINRHCSTIPDWPFNPARNGWKAMPTMVSGIYDITAVNHNGNCPGFEIQKDKVIRFNSQTSFYASTSGYINIHRRFWDELSDKHYNSQGCIVIGNVGTEPDDEYARYAVAIGLINAGDSGTSRFRRSISGKVIIDRSFAGNYLRSVGYSPQAISMIG